MGIEDTNEFDRIETLESFNNEIADEKECIDCSNLFSITQGEVNYFIQHELIAPKRCKPCRAARRANSTPRTPEVHRTPSSPSFAERVRITCDHCGRDADVPFKPFPDSSVYCKVCWVGIKNIGTPINYNSPQQR